MMKQQEVVFSVWPLSCRYHVKFSTQSDQPCSYFSDLGLILADYRSFTDQRMLAAFLLVVLCSLSIFKTEFMPCSVSGGKIFCTVSHIENRKCTPFQTKVAQNSRIPTYLVSSLSNEVCTPRDLHHTP